MILAFIVLSWLVLIHEVGHFVVARWSKVKIEEFGLGYPPLAKKLFRRWGVDFTLNWIPFGGFVKMVGEENPTETNSHHPAHEIKKVTQSDKSGLFPLYTRPAWQRIAVMAAGAAVNIAFAIIAFSIVFSIKGIPQELTQARIGEIQPNSPAAAAGLPSQVEIIAIEVNGVVEPITTVEVAQKTIKAHQGETITIVTTGPCQPACQESAARYQVYVRTDAEHGPDQGAVGIVFQDVIFVHYPWYEMPLRGSWFGVKQAFFMAVLTLQTLQGMISALITTGRIPTAMVSQLSGPIGIVDQVSKSQIIQQGFLAVLGMAGSLSLGLGIMNLLPIPPLDGGRIVFVLLEQVIGKRNVAKVEGYSHSVGMVFLFGLIILISAHDIWRIVVR